MAERREEGRERGRKDGEREGGRWGVQKRGVDYRFTIRQAEPKH